MRVHVKFKQNENLVDRYFIHPLDVITEKNMTLNEGLRQAEYYMKAGCFVIPAVTYESASGDERFIIGVFKKEVTSDEFRKSSPAEGYYLSPPVLMETPESIKKNIERVREYIREGHTYQVNYTTRLEGKFQGSAHVLFEQLMSENNGGYAVYLEYDGEVLVSCSPELFFEIMPDRTIRARPMKGTAPRGTDAETDRDNYQFLKRSEKDRAENVMIVDLLRNDLSRIAEKNTVSVPECFTIEKYATVYQMTSTVEATVRESVGLPEIFQSLFPCGSITGAPKQSTMNIINALEATPRGYYCGTIGIMYPDESMVFNIPIRTLQIKAGRYIYGAGAGITYDSSAESEYREIMDKTAFLKRGVYELIETMRVTDGIPARLELHINRYEASCAAFGFKTGHLSDEVYRYIKAHHLDNGSYRLRVTGDSEGGLTITHTIFEDSGEVLQAVLSARPICSPKLFLEHKTTVRHQYQLPDDDFNVVLYYNDRQQLTEFNIGNLVIESEGRYYTPKMTAGLLNGVMRQSLIRSGTLEERNYTVLELKDQLALDSVQLYMINSVRGFVKIELNMLG